MLKHILPLAFGLALLPAHAVFAQGAPEAPASAPAYDAALAKSLGADERGMRGYVLVVLKTGPKKVPAGEERTKMFQGHFANINRLAAEGKLAVAGPLDGVDGWRGIFILATGDIDEAKKHVETDPVIINGEMVAEYHKFYGSAGLMLVNQTHKKITQGN
ncbi:MAG TPA: YciI family protein [Paucimonas sp.]|nr:YciI family protein [Paucimonas sp.]